ncbi:hypothetical protein BDQ17DRAFT_1245003 [Cyathus striatus]|nr:hypothetical protein BDQ17DRAFT_1245003 [Cyathus striatus]
MQALHDIVQAGYIRYIGMSSQSTQCKVRSLHYSAINNKLTPFISMQNHFSLVYVSLAAIENVQLRVGSIPWAPLARGLLIRPPSAQTERGEVDR